MQIEEMNIEDIQRGYRKKEFTAVEIITVYFNRIKALDKIVGGFISLREEAALLEAKAIDRKIQKDEKIGELAGIPIALKDNICTKDLKTTCASKMLEDFVSPYDATTVTRLKDAGGIIIGKTNMDEFAMGSSTENSAFQITKNPWNLQKVSGGSSGGSAAVVAAGFSPLAFASDIDGSLRQPASFCGVVGLKPTYGLVSRYGLITPASSLDQMGPLTKTVEDCALSLQIMQGKDIMDSTSYQGDLPKNYADEFKKGIKGFKVGVPKELFQEDLDPEIANAINKSIKNLEEMGAIIQEFSLPAMDNLLLVNYIISSAEASSNLARYDGISYGYRSKTFDGIDELMINSRSETFGKEVKRRIMLGSLVLSSGYYDKYYNRARILRNKIKADFNKALEKYDVILTPTAPILPFDIGKNTGDSLDVDMSKTYTVGANIAGLPAISIPCGFSSCKLPIGLQFIGNYYEENKLFNIAYNLEQTLGVYREIPILKEVQ